MTYEEFRSEILRKLEEKKNDLGYEQVKYYPDGFTSVKKIGCGGVGGTKRKKEML